MHPIVTIFCPFTRPWAVDLWLNNLDGVTHDPALTNLCFIVDGDQSVIANTLRKFAESRQYRSFHVKVNSEWRPNEVQLSIRRMRIADVNNQAKDLVAQTDGEYVVGFEDDTVFDRMDSFDKLLYPLQTHPDVGFVEGVQIGRWGAKIVGAWSVNDIDNATEVKTLMPATGIEEITSGGWYGYATRRHLFMNCENYTSSAQPWGPDVNFGVYIQRQGYKCLINWDLLFGHSDYNAIAYPDDPKIRLAQVVYNKNKATGKWDRTDHEPAYI